MQRSKNSASERIKTFHLLEMVYGNIQDILTTSVKCYFDGLSF